MTYDIYPPIALLISKLSHWHDFP